MNTKHLKALIIACWAMLGVCCVLKLLGLNVFTVGTTNEHTIMFFTFIDKHTILKIIGTCFVSLVLNTLTLLAILQQKFYTKCQTLVFVPLIITASVLGWYFSTLSLILNFVTYFLTIIYLKSRWYRCFVGIGLTYVFQILSIIIKNVGGWALYTTSYLPSMLLQIDSIIMLILFYLYSIRKEVS